MPQGKGLGGCGIKGDYPMEVEHEGVTQKRLNRLWRHLLKLERLTGMPLRKKPRYRALGCPVDNLAPDKDDKGNYYCGANILGNVGYVPKKPRRGTLFSPEEVGSLFLVYTEEDSEWWARLTLIERQEVTDWVIKKIAERGKK
jgi:hypothetical protein